ncbi:putative toxin-antitoxin system toxin component, PIN family [Prosthecobacter sp.]|uniref:putative toxin-antitoxin system toxin component, PIN family n=1 Tax=Prosthecobacter sp. TaxID=1965333 RepID=UPI00248824DD|nr:putative toxin-antitoxin system toxin component, PIN family [Prosthecobacter sp.]MDI1315646.1 putative toxin-antitoxin system toxin component, PIN family [Prosthecobacter sp.]
MIRAILDTNVILSALRSRNGASFQIVARYRQGEFALYLSQTVLAEYDEVLKREMLPQGLPMIVINRFLDALASNAVQFRTSAFWKPSLPDPDDEALAQLAMESKIDYLVTHNLRHFPASRLPAVRVVDPKTFLDILRLSS